LEVIKFLNFYRIPVKKWTFHNIMKFITYFLFFGIIYTIFCFFLCFAICYTQSEAYGCWFETWKSLMRDRPFNLKGGGYGFLFLSEFFFRTIQELEYFFVCREKRNFFFQNLTLGYMAKTLNHIISFFLYQNQNIFFSIIGNQNIFLEKKT
jgi:hypothetical protein